MKGLGKSANVYSFPLYAVTETPPAGLTFRVKNRAASKRRAVKDSKRAFLFNGGSNGSLLTFIRTLFQQ